MPIAVDDIITDDAPVSVSPKFFASCLTGSGKKGGLLNENITPQNPGKSAHALNTVAKSFGRNTKHTVNDVTTYNIPLAPLHRNAVELLEEFSTVIPDTEKMFDLGELTNTASGKIAQGWLNLTPQAMVIYEESKQNPNDPDRQIKVKDVNIEYRLDVFAVLDSTDETASGTTSTSVKTAADENQVFTAFGYLPTEDTLDGLMATVARCWDVSVDPRDPADHVKLVDWLENNYSVHARITELANTWCGDEIGDIVSRYITDCLDNVHNVNTSTPVNSLGYHTPLRTTAEALSYQLKYLENYNVSLENYRQMYKTMATYVETVVLNRLANLNMNLLMNSRMDRLDQGRTNVPVLNVTDDALNDVPDFFSAQQRGAVTTAEPFVMVQAAAGTGKTTTIMERIKFLENCGVNPSNVRVLSFTNAAADNVTERNPGVSSMTIAKMINTIYAANYPNHKLSTIDTLQNSLEIYFANDQLAIQFHQHLKMMLDNKQGAWTEMNTFIENYFPAVENMLNRIGQTTLEMQIIFCYQRIDHMVEPGAGSVTHLIIDEVQDNSLFEFIYTLSYVAKHQINLYIVGDASQTLYEFRSSNPKALNALESSGVFQTHQLTTNYRSKQEILDFANVSLTNIEANKYAKMQMRSNDLTQPTAVSFQNSVHLDYRAYPKLAHFHEQLPGIVRIDIKPFLDDALAKDEQTIFLAPTRREVTLIQTTLENLYPNESVSSLVSEKTFNSTVFSTYINKFWNDVKQVDPAQAAYTVTQEIQKNLSALTFSAQKALPAVTRMMQSWWTSNSQEINSWVYQYQAGQITRDKFFDLLQQNMMDYEIKNNAARLQLVSQRNAAQKKKNAASNAKILVSTIHGVKGLEFDNAVVIHKYNAAMDEPTKRMYYVAFTRAKSREYILSYGTTDTPQIKADYQQIVDTLEENDHEAQLAAMFEDSDEMSNEVTSTPDDDEAVSQPLADPNEHLCPLDDAYGEDAQFTPETSADTDAEAEAAADSVDEKNSSARRYDRFRR